MSDINGNNYAPPAPGFGPYDWLDSFNDNAQPQHQFRAKLETVPNGDHDWEILDAALDKINNDDICRIGLRVDGGRVVEHIYGLKDQRGVNAFMAEMAVLGFPADKWGSGPGKTPLSKAIPECVARLRNIKFRGTKTSREGTGSYAGKVYHDLLASGRLAGAPMPPTVPPQVSAPRPAVGADTERINNIPF